MKKIGKMDNTQEHKSEGCKFNAEILHKLPTVLTADELINKAFGKASKVSDSKTGKNKMKRKRDKYINKLATISNVLTTYFNKIIESHPSYTSMPDFYRELVDATVGIKELRKSLAALKWADSTVQKIITKSIKQIKSGKNPDLVLKSAYGRVASIVNQINDELEFLNEAKKKMRRFPVFLDFPVVVFAGYPNVGKSSIVSALSTVKPRIDTYPFTTKEIYVGIMKTDSNKKIQIVDTPGILDRPINKRNKIEKRAISCIKYLAECIVFVIDPTETCGYEIEKQISLLEEIKELKKPILEIYSKADLHSKRDRLAVSCKTGEGIPKLKEMICKMVFD